jgi:predicted HTH transcriptional regulator
MVVASIFLGVARATISRDVAELRASGMLAHEGPTKGGRWVVA